MASAAKSRWADTDEDAAFEAKRRKEKEEKKRAKAAERARKEAAAKEEAARKAADEADEADETDEADGRGAHSDNRPSKRRKLTPERGNARGGGVADDGVSSDKDKDKDAGTEGTILRLTGGALPEPCQSVERYDKLNDIEEGAYGWVARARDKKTGDVVALKRLKLDAVDRSGVPVTGLREIQLLKDCAHRNIVALREVVVGDRRPVDNILLVLEFVEHDLKSILEDMPQPFLASEVKTLLRQLAAGVAYLHGHWILHRDLKTSNLLLNNRGQLKIADFGMARYYSDDGSSSSSSAGASEKVHGGAYLTPLVVTLWYRAPELLLGARRYGRAVDMWSVGCIFGELLTREPLLQGKNEADELSRIFDLCGVPTDTTWPGFRRLPNARALRLPPSSALQPTTTTTATATTAASIRAKFPLLTSAGCQLLSSLLALDPARRPTADGMLGHEYFRQDPRAKQEALFPTFPSKAGQERRRKRDTPNAPQRGAAVADLGSVDFAGIFGGRDKEERGAGFSLRMV